MRFLIGFGAIALNLALFSLLGPVAGIISGILLWPIAIGAIFNIQPPASAPAGVIVTPPAQPTVVITPAAPAVVVQRPWHQRIFSWVPRRATVVHPPAAVPGGGRALAHAVAAPAVHTAGAHSVPTRPVPTRPVPESVRVVAPRGSTARDVAHNLAQPAVNAAGAAPHGPRILPGRPARR
jgi:hypothetical protein